MNTKKLITLLLCSLFLLPGQIVCMNNTIIEAVENNDIEKITLLLNCGTDVNFEVLTYKYASWFHDANKFPFLLFAALNDRSDIVKLLLRYGANINGADNLSWTIQEWAVLPEMLDPAKNINELVKNNKFENLYKILAKEPIYDRYLLSYTLFQVQSKKQFKQFKKECAKNGILNLEQLMYSDISPQLLTHFLKLNILIWENKMFTIFPTLQQKKEVIIYGFNDKTISQIPYYDLKINYNS